MTGTTARSQDCINNYDNGGIITMKTEVYIEIGFDGKVRKFVYGNGYYTKIYKQYSRQLEDWVSRLSGLLESKRYTKEQIKNILKHCYQRGYYVTNNYYIKPASLVQRVLEVGYENLEIV